MLQEEKRPEDKESHVKLANGDKNSINKPDKIALKPSSQIKNSDWWINSGASQHMTPEKKSLDDYSTFETPLKVKLADDIVLHVYGKGNVHLTVLNDNDKINIVLKDVLFISKLQNKLFSLPLITKKELLSNSKVKHVELPLMESSTPSAISTVSFTN